MKLPLAITSCCAIVYAAATDAYRDTTDHAAYVIKFNPAYNASSGKLLTMTCICTCTDNEHCI